MDTIFQKRNKKHNWPLNLNKMTMDISKCAIEYAPLNVILTQFRCRLKFIDTANLCNLPAVWQYTTIADFQLLGD